MKKIKYLTKHWFGNFSLSFKDGFPENTEKYFDFPFATIDKNGEYELKLVPSKEEIMDFPDYHTTPSNNRFSITFYFLPHKENWRKLEISSDTIRYTDSQKQKLEWIYQNEFNTIPKEIKNIIVKVVEALEIAANKTQEAKVEQKRRERDFELELQQQTETDVRGFFNRFEEKKR